jgi:hypothetical protein
MPYFIPLSACQLIDFHDWLVCTDERQLWASENSPRRCSGTTVIGMIDWIMLILPMATPVKGFD